MPDFDPSAPPPDYNSMQQQAGLLSPLFTPPPVVFPGQISAALSSGGVAAVSAVTAPGAGGAALAAYQTGPGGGGGFSPAFGASMGPGAAYGGGGPFQQFMGGGGGFGFQSQQIPTFTNMPPMLQGPSGIMMPMQAGAPFNAYSAANPYEGLGAGRGGGHPGLYEPRAPLPPPSYGGQWGQMPLGPPPPASQFDSPFQAALSRQQLSADEMYQRTASMGGVGARIGTDVMGGLAGATLGMRFGGMRGAIAGGIAGFAGAELGGLGEGAQNVFMNQVASPLMQRRAQEAGIQDISRGFITGGEYLHESGAGFTRRAAREMTGGLREMAESDTFKRETQDRFNTQDVMKITQLASENNMMTGVQSPQQATGRVREVARALSSFMELAQEPDIQRAIQTMGSLRTSGLNLSETQQAVSQGRAFARMAGTSFQDLMATGGAMGSQTFQSMGLTQGLGMQTGMMNYGQARATEMAGTLSPQMMNLVGGAQGYAGMNNMFSANMLQLPMMGPGMMTGAGGISPGAVQAMAGGQTSLFDITRQGAGALQGMTGRMGVEGLGAAVAMQPLVQDTTGRMLQAMGPFAQRNAEDQQIMALSRGMGMRGSAGFVTAGMAAGMDRNQAMARVAEMQSPAYFERQRQQIEVRRREGNAAEARQAEADRPGFTDIVQQRLGWDGSNLRSASRWLGTTFGAGEQSEYRPETDMARRREQRFASSREYQQSVRALDRQVEARQQGPLEGGILRPMRDQYDLDRAHGLGSVPALARLIPGADLFMGRPATRQQQTAELQDLAGGSRLASAAGTSSAVERATAGRRMERDMGADRAGAVGSEFTHRLLERATQGPQIPGTSSRLGSIGMGVANAAWEIGGGRIVQSIAGGIAGGPAGFLAGMMAPTGSLTQRSAMSATEMRRMFIQTATEQGRMSPQAAAQMWDRDGGRTVMQAQGERIEQEGTREERAAWHEQQQQMAGAGGGRGGRMQQIAENVSNVRQRAFGTGQTSAALSDAFQRTYENVRGVGAEGSQQQTRSRPIIMAMAQLRAVVRNGTPERAADARRQLRQVEEEARRQHVDLNDPQFASQVRAASSTMDSGVGLDAANRFVDTHNRSPAAAIIGAVEATGSGLSAARIQAREAGGLAAMAGQHNAVGDALRAAGIHDASDASHERAVAAFTNMTSEQLRQVDPRMRRQIQALQSARTPEERARAEGQLFTTQIDTAGERVERARQQHRESRRGIMGAGRRILENLGIGQTEEEAAAAAAATTTRADRRAGEETTATNAAEAAAREAGIGGPGDAMMEAAENLNNAAQALQAIASGGSLDGLLTPGAPPAGGH